jgi:SAM-dependent methyltransferase
MNFQRFRRPPGTGSIPPWELPPLPGESEAAHQARKNEEYFKEQLLDNEEWWRRLGHRFDFKNKRVLDLGCGHGALSISIAQAGAAKVVGVDIEADYIGFASQVLAERYGTLRDKVEFRCGDIRTTSEHDLYDYVVCKDSFEHIQDLPGVTASIFKLLKKPEGRLIVGFSPLYYSPLGDHGRLALPGVWLHAIMPERLLLKHISRKAARPVSAISDLGLNKLTPDQFRALFPEPAWKMVTLRYNQRCRLSRVLNLTRKVPGLEKYCTVNIYCVVETTN